MSVKCLEVDDDIDVYVVGDIHGCHTLLINNLKEIGFKFHKDLLISVGDLVDRGKENEKCFGLLNELWFTCIKGNHEDFCYKGVMDSSVAFYHKMPNNGGQWFYEQPEQIQEHIARRFNSLPVLLEVKYKGGKFGFVHANSCVEDWELLKEMVSNNDMFKGRDVVDDCLWVRDIVYKDNINIGQVDNVFFGHTPLKDIKQSGNCTFLDTGACFDGGKLSIVKLSDYC